MTVDSTRIEDLLLRLRQGQEECLAELFSIYQEKLGRMVNFRMDPRLRGRLDVSDVLQEIYLDAAKRISHYFEVPSMSFYVWLRLLAGQRLADLHRRTWERRPATRTRKCP